MTGDDHGNNGTQGGSTHFAAASAPGCSVDDWELRPRHVLRLSVALRSRPRRRRPSKRQGFEIAAHINDRTAPTTHRRRCCADLSRRRPRGRSRRRSRACRRRATNRTHCIVVERLHDAGRGRARQGRCAWTRTTTTGPATWVNDTARPVHRLGLPDAIRRSRRLVHRRVPGRDADDRRVGAELPVHDRHAARSGARRGGLLRHVRRQHPHRYGRNDPRADAIVASAQARGVPVISARQLLTWIDGRNASRFEASRLGWQPADGSRSRPATAHGACRRCCRWPTGRVR